MMLCIKCQTEMIKTIFESVLVDYCPRCKSFWLDGEEFERSLYEKGFDVEHTHKKAVIENKEESTKCQDFSLCPRCQATNLSQVMRDGVILDQCPSCHGIFFDDGELERCFDSERPTFIDRMWRHICDIL